MQGNFIRYAFIALVILVTIAMLWRSEDSTTVISAESETAQEADSFALNTELKSFNSLGELAFQLSGAEAKLFLPQNQVVFSLPVSSLQSPNGDQWHLQADQAIYHMSSEQAEFSGNVRLEHTSKNLQKTVLTTDSISLDNKQRFIHTQSAVRITQERNTLTTNGMKIWMDEKRMQLLSKVRAQYHPGTTAPKSMTHHFSPNESSPVTGEKP